MAIRITIATEPVAKGRPRVTLSQGHFRTYTPEKTLIAQDFIKARLLRHREQAFPAGVPLRLTCTFYRTKSRYLPKRETLPFRKPDTPNFVSLICDAMTSVLYDDDAQLTTIVARKRWSNDGVGYITIKLESDKE